MIPLTFKGESETCNSPQIFLLLGLGNHPRIDLLDFTRFAFGRYAEVLYRRADSVERQQMRIGMDGLSACGLKEQLSNLWVSLVERPDTVRGIATVGVGFPCKRNLKIDFCLYPFGHRFSAIVAEFIDLPQAAALSEHSGEQGNTQPKTCAEFAKLTGAHGTLCLQDSQTQTW
jgi:hypothetical protein